MSPTKLPDGRYLSCPIRADPDAGGQTRALLMRNRILVTEAGISPIVASFNARTDLPEERAILLERGLLLPEISTPNIFEHYREHGWDDDPPTECRPLEDLSKTKISEEYFPDGTPFRFTYRAEDDATEIHDLMRADGSVYLRIPKFVYERPTTWPSSLLRVGPDNTVWGRFGSVKGWFQQFVRMLAGDERTFLFIDSRYNVAHLVPLEDPNIHVLYVLHNMHKRMPWHWSSPSNVAYARLMTLVDEFDALVTLTQRQQDDIAMLRGRGSNMFVIPNPVDMPEIAGPPAARDPDQVTLVARLDKQKRIAQAIRAVVKARKTVPTVRLDVFGAGERRPELEEVIRRTGSKGFVTLRGHDPAAREKLWTSSAFLMTSSFEGYPLSTLESMSHGCPVISYDIKYGPREQITDGVDGFLVPDKAVNQMAARIVQLLQDPELVARMSEAALEKARHHDKGRFLDEWRQVLEQTVERKPYRTRLDEVRVDVSRLEVTGRMRRRAGARPVSVGRRGRIAFEGRLHVAGHSARSTLESAQVTLAAIHEETGKSVDLPLSVLRDGSEFTLSAKPLLTDIFEENERLIGVRLRLRLVWENSTWNTLLARPDEGSNGDVEATYDADGSLALSTR